MTDVEKVISDLEEQVTWIRDNDFHKFPGWGHAVIAMKDALPLLKAQEPRLVTIDDFKGANEYGWLQAWCEEQTGGAVYCECILADALKAKRIRYWTSRPTDEQREAEPWRS